MKIFIAGGTGAIGRPLSPALYSREGTVEKVVRKIHELGQQGVQFATFPETVVPYYPYFSIVQSGYQIIVGGQIQLSTTSAGIAEETAPTSRTTSHAVPRIEKHRHKAVL
jgi:nitrilase